MAFRRTFQLVITIVLIGIFIGISPADCEDKVEDRSSKDYDDFAVARQESPTPSRIRRLMEFIRLRLSNNQGKLMFYIAFGVAKRFSVCNYFYLQKKMLVFRGIQHGLVIYRYRNCLINGCFPTKWNFIWGEHNDFHFSIMFNKILTTLKTLGIPVCLPARAPF